ncbi:MAG: 50S ribosomal protein L31 [SAR324 cluster bacterium]|nr:50S ribosomal protein L31 [SAR324 cluster bacterium]
MKPNIHPNYQPTTFTCTCGAVFQTHSVLGGDRNLEICSQCHPFFSGKGRMFDSAGRIDKFKKRYNR